MRLVVFNGHLFGSGEGGAVGAGAVFGGRGAARDLEGLRQRLTLHLSTQTLLVERGLEEPRVAVELHQVEDLRRRDEQNLRNNL